MQTFAYDMLDSTNEEARRLLAGGAIDDAAVVIARGQAAGRGTHGRSWISPYDAGLYLSYACRNRGDQAQQNEWPLTTEYTLAAGVACAEAVREAFNIDLRIKPVNDLIRNGRKVGGVLTEAFVEEGRLTALIIGVGINVLPAVRSLPPGSMAVASLAEIDPAIALDSSSNARLARCVTAKLGIYTKRVTAGAGQVIGSAWRDLLIEGATLPESLTALGRAEGDSQESSLRRPTQEAGPAQSSQPPFGSPLH